MSGILRSLGLASAENTGQKPVQSGISGSERGALMQDTGLATEQGTLRNIWRLMKPYFQSDQKWKAGLLLGSVVALTLGAVGIEVLLNNWNKNFYNALEQKDFPEFMKQLGVFSALAGAFIGDVVYRQYLQQMLQLNCRTWLTKTFTDKWMDNKAYHLMTGNKKADNPDQRIADDLDKFPASVLSLGLGLMSSTVELASFAGILWGLSGTLDVTVPVLGAISVPGYMLWAGLAYAAAGTVINRTIGRPLSRLLFGQQKKEADFRFSLVRVRENTEAIASLGGEAIEKGILSERFNKIAENWRALMNKNKQLTAFTSGYSQLSTIFPVLAIAPRYFAGQVKLGGLFQTASAFRHVQSSFDWLIDSFANRADLKATTDRLIGFMDAIEQTKAQMEALSPQKLGKDGLEALVIENLRLTRPDGEVLAENINLTLKSGESAAITGASGSGKSTLRRAVQGIWPNTEGRIAVREGDTVLCIPQKPYLPLVPLEGILAYPREPGAVTREDMEDVLNAVRLGRLIPELDDAAKDGVHWTQTLSGGEQQKIVIARALLLKPQVLVLDEGFSALDSDAEHGLHTLLKTRLPETALVSITHRPQVIQFHTYHAHLENKKLAVERVPSVALPG